MVTIAGDKETVKREPKDLILDIQFDHFGTRFATASADQHIRVYKRNEKGEFLMESAWVAHTATIWHLDWAHPHHGTIIASCSFDKYLKIWMPPEARVKDGRMDEKRRSQDWQEIEKHSVDKRGSVTDVRFSPVWFPSNGSEENDDGFEGGSKVYIACCTSDGQAKIYQASTPVSKKTQFNEERALQIIRNGNNSNFRCTTLDWSRLRYSDQLIAIGSEGNAEKNSEHVRLYRYSSRVRDLPDDSLQGECGNDGHSWLLLEKQGKDLSEKIEGPVNLIRFAANIGTNVHLCAIAATNIHIATINPAKDFEVQQMRLLNNLEPFDSHEKCWRLCWDSCLRLFSVHGDRVYLWNRNSQSGENAWVAELFPS